MIFVQTTVGYNVGIRISENSTILQLKNELRGILGIPPHQLVILAGGHTTYPNDKILSKVLAEGGGKPFIVKVVY